MRGRLEEEGRDGVRNFSVTHSEREREIWQRLNAGNILLALAAAPPPLRSSDGIGAALNRASVCLR